MTKNPFAPNPELKIWIGDGLVPAPEAKISVFDHGLLYGDGVFEGIRIYNGKIFLEDQHIKRFFESARAIRLEIPMSPQQVSDAMHKTMQANGIDQDGYIRLVVTRGEGRLGLSIKNTSDPKLIVIADKIALYPPEVCKRGLKVVFSSLVRNHPNSISPRVKSLNYLNNILAKAEAQAAGADEAIMLTTHGTVAECSGDNLFIVKRGAIHTPPVSEGILEGVTRNLIIELGRKAGYTVHETVLTRHDLYISDECFVTGTAAEVVPITNLDGRVVGDGTAGPITKRLLEAFIAFRNAQ